jgi:hypothetical protein
MRAAKRGNRLRCRYTPKLDADEFDVVLVCLFQVKLNSANNAFAGDMSARFEEKLYDGVFLGRRHPIHGNEGRYESKRVSTLLCTYLSYSATEAQLLLRRQARQACRRSGCHFWKQIHSCCARSRRLPI